MSKQFYSFVKNEAGDSELILDGVIASESWFDDEISPAAFREELLLRGDLERLPELAHVELEAVSDLLRAQTVP